MPLVDARSGNRRQGIALSTCQNNAFLGQALHLLAQSVDMRFDSMRAQAVLETPDLGQQLFLCNAVGVRAIKIFQNGRFLFSQDNLPAFIFRLQKLVGRQKAQATN